jgi:hypothetical protein
MINCLHHFEILTQSSKKLLNLLVNGLNFNLIAAKQSGPFKQYLVNSNSINYIITDFSDTALKKNDINFGNLDKFSDSFANYAYKCPLESIEAKSKTLYETILTKQNTVFNAAFQVRDIDRILANCSKYNVKILENKHILFDKQFSSNGYVECAVIESCIDGVVHSLFDKKNYNGRFLPSFDCITSKFDQNELTEKNVQSQTNLTHFDHLTYAIFENTSQNVIDWYANIFNMRRFKIEKKENDGLIVHTGESGMNIKVINYWLCAETGCLEFDSKLSSSDTNTRKEALSTSLFDNSFKFVISEPLLNTNSNKSNNKNQISIFLEENKGPGIQHIGMFANDIVKAVEESKLENNEIKYYETPDHYYKLVKIYKQLI